MRLNVGLNAFVLNGLKIKLVKILYPGERTEQCKQYV